MCWRSPPDGLPASGSRLSIGPGVWCKWLQSPWRSLIPDTSAACNKKGSGMELQALLLNISSEDPAGFQQMHDSRGTVTFKAVAEEGGAASLIKSLFRSTAPPDSKGTVSSPSEAPALLVAPSSCRSSLGWGKVAFPDLGLMATGGTEDFLGRDTITNRISKKPPCSKLEMG